MKPNIILYRPNNDECQGISVTAAICVKIISAQYKLSYNKFYKNRNELAFTNRNGSISLKAHIGAPI